MLGKVRTVSVAGLLVVYNAIRGVLTFKIAPLRDEEDRSHYTPKRADIDWYYRLHDPWRGVLWWVSVVSTGLLAWQVYGWLATRVWVPSA